MKKILIFLLINCFLTTVKAQYIEVKASPLGFFLYKYNVNVEYVTNQQIGIDFSPSYTHYESNRQSAIDSYQRNTVGLQLAAKYYIGSEKGGDGFSFGPYFSYYSTKFTNTFQNTTTSLIETNIRKADPQWVVGGMTTYKKVYDNNFVIEAGIGSGYILTGARNIGVAFLENPFAKIDVTVRFAVGYRFSGKKELIKK
jgi:hypothetical protein